MKNDIDSKGNSFRSILKGTSMFGGVQVFNILISTIRLKFVAVILGPAGIGVAGLFNTASLTIQQLASLGLNLAVVKEIGASKEKEEKLRDVLASVRRLGLITALAGALICICLPGMLSNFTFGNDRYRTSFIIMAAAIFFSIAGTALMSVLQGLHEVRRLSKASLVGSLTGLGVGVPMYWLWGTDGIVPAMVVLALFTCLWYWFSLRKSLRVTPAAWTSEIHLPILKRILAMGVILMSNDLFKNLVNYLILIYVRATGNEMEVGFYQSCNTMTSQYSAIVFTAMAMDYLPRLSAAANDNRQLCAIVNRQIEVVGLLVAPIVCAVIFLAPWVIELLQTKAFTVATPLLRILALAVAVRGLMYPLGYIVFAKDNRRLFFWMESIGANILTLTIMCGGYSLFGLNGLGYAAVADCTICLLVYIAVNHHLYGYRLSRRAFQTSAASLASAAGMAAICFLSDGLLMTGLASALLIAVGAICGRRILGIWKK